MSGEKIVTYHTGDTWRNRVEAGPDLPGEYAVKATAVAVGHDEAVRRRVEHEVRDMEGTMRAWAQRRSGAGT